MALVLSKTANSKLKIEVTKPLSQEDFCAWIEGWLTEPKEMLMFCPVRLILQLQHL